mmetsp:Transcript_2821/g.11122  ORF Transcript_2821/g.11122 Transcript_2821/m.11122 type:complete len:322 (-) Transcript_2821:255-1220(-)
MAIKIPKVHRTTRRSRSVHPQVLEARLHQQDTKHPRHTFSARATRHQHRQSTGFDQFRKAFVLPLRRIWTYPLADKHWRCLPWSGACGRSLCQREGTAASASIASPCCEACSHGAGHASPRAPRHCRLPWSSLPGNPGTDGGLESMRSNAPCEGRLPPCRWRHRGRQNNRREQRCQQGRSAAERLAGSGARSASLAASEQCSRMSAQLAARTRATVGNSPPLSATATTNAPTPCPAANDVQVVAGNERSAQMPSFEPDPDDTHLLRQSETDSIRHETLHRRGKKLQRLPGSLQQLQALPSERTEFPWLAPPASGHLPTLAP